MITYNNCGLGIINSQFILKIFTMTLIYILFILISHLFYSQSQTVSYYFQFGDDHVIPCEIFNPNINVAWYKDSLLVSTLNITTLSVGNDGSLHLSDYSFAHTGYYHCENASFGFQLFIECGLNAEEVIESGMSVCACAPGHYRNQSTASYSCVQCPISTHKPHPGDHVCFPCPTSRVTLSEGETDLSNCVCIPGFGTVSPSDLCVPCPADYFQPYAEYIPCVQCPQYSGTPPIEGEADSEGYTLKSDCICQFSKGNADNSTCYAFVTNANITIFEITQSSFVVSFEREMYARAEDGSLRGNIDRYYVELSTASTLVTFHSLNDLTNLFTISLTFTGLQSGVEYSVVVSAYVTDMEGAPSLVNVILMMPTVTTISQTKTTTTTTTTKPVTPSTASLPTMSSIGVLIWSLVFLLLL